MLHPITVTRSARRCRIRFRVSISRTALILSFLFIAFTPWISDAVPITPDKDITVVNQQQEVPRWKQLWDEARALGQKQEYLEAIKRYEAILTEKPNIEEVKWELCQAYIAIEQYEEASVLLESLLEGDGDRIEYLISGGTLALQEDRTEQAIEYFGQALEADPGGQYGDEALAGLARALVASGNTRAAIPLMEQLHNRLAIDPSLLHQLARLSWENGYTEKAAHYYGELVKKYRVDPEIIREAANVCEQLGRVDEAADYWQSYLLAVPDSLLFRQKLTNYLLDVDRNEEALEHIEVLLTSNIDREQHLLRAAEIYLYELGRIDKALNYYQEYKREFPGGRDVSIEIEQLQLILANDLLSIVENAGVWMLWRDLALVTPGRVDIYRVMADMLEDTGRQDELIEVLQIIIVHEPGDTGTRIRLAKIYEERDNIEACLAILGSEHVKEPLAADFYRLRASCEAQTGRDISTLNDLARYLQKSPGDESTRVQAIQLAGALGLVQVMQELYADYRQNIDAGASRLPPVVESYLAGLIDNYLFSTAESEIDSLIQGRDLGEQLLIDLEMMRASIYFGRGKLFEAERVLRQLVVRSGYRFEPLIMLSRIALEQQDLETAGSWLDLAQQEAAVDGEAAGTGIKHSKIFYQNLLMTELGGKQQRALAKAIEYLHTGNAARQLIDQDVDILVYVAINQIRQEKYSEALELLRYYKKTFRSEQVLDLLIQVAEASLQAGHDISADDTDPTKDPMESVTGRIDRAEILFELGRYNAVSDLIKPLLAELPDSVRTRSLLAQTGMRALEYDTALRHYESLAKLLPDEAYFSEQMRRIRYLTGSQEEILARYDPQWVNGVPGESVNYATADLNTIIDILFYARALWAENRWDEALVIYDDINIELNKRISESMLLLKETPEYKTYNPRSFWEDLLYSPEDEEYLDVLLSPFHFSQIHDTEAGFVAASLYDTYRWDKIVKLEKDAKSALNAKEFYQAEQEYQELIETDTIAAEEAYPDLATVLSRLGRRKEEAELLEKIKELNLEYPVLEAATAKDIRQRKPHLSIEGKYREEEGRQGYKNIVQKYLGGEISLTPTASQEAGVWFARNEYGNSESSTLAKSIYVTAKHAMRLNDFIDTTASIGFEDFDTDGKSFLLYELAGKSRFQGGVGLYASLGQAPVDDTIESLAEGIYRRDFTAGLTMDFLPSLFMGFEFSARDYSDDNDGNEFNIWGSFRYFTERSSVNINYDYQKIENSIANSSINPRPTQHVDEELPYWSPGSYWKHLLSAEYRLELWQTGRLQSGTSFLSGRYGIGYEKGDNLLQELELKIFVEINKIFLVKGTFGSEWSSDFDKQEGTISLSYRW
jgi:tetratricopeptide (TPR) repeat protein